MITLSFQQTRREFMVRIAASLLFERLRQRGAPLVPLSELAEHPQYGFTAKASHDPVGPRLVRITDLQDARIEWETVPYCQCEQPEKYLLAKDDILFARTGATTGKTHLVTDAEYAVFASYLIRVRPQPNVVPAYLYGFFQSDLYWQQVVKGKEGSAQANVNGKKLAGVVLPRIDGRQQEAVATFLAVVRKRQDGEKKALPALPRDLAGIRQIVAKIERLATKIDEVRGLQERVLQSCDALLRSMMFEADGGARRVPMNEIVQLRDPDIEVEATETYRFAGVYCFGRGLFSGDLKTGLDTSYKRLTSLRTHDFVYPKLMAWEGALATVPEECSGLVVSTEFPVFEIDSDLALPETLDVYFRTPAIWEELASISTGTNVRRRRLQPKDFLRYEMLLPSMARQIQLRTVKMKVEAVRQLRMKTAAELDSLLPSILDRAFKGEL